VVGLDVALEDVGDPHPLLAGRLQIGLDLMLWIHHSAGRCARSAEDVAGAAGLGGEKLSEDHGRSFPSFLPSLFYAPAWYRVQYLLWILWIGKIR
jgi:hypothetical protein